MRFILLSSLTAAVSRPGFENGSLRRLVWLLKVVPPELVGKKEEATKARRKRKISTSSVYVHLWLILFVCSSRVFRVFRGFFLFGCGCCRAKSSATPATKMFFLEIRFRRPRFADPRSVLSRFVIGAVQKQR